LRRPWRGLILARRLLLPKNESNAKAVRHQGWTQATAQPTPDSLVAGPSMRELIRHRESRASVVLPGCARPPRGGPGFLRFCAL